MPGHRLDARTRRALKRGLTIRIKRGFQHPAGPERPASACRKIDPLSGKVTGIVIRPAAGRLRISGGGPWRVQRPATKAGSAVRSCPAQLLAETARLETAPALDAHQGPPVALCAAGLTNAAPTIGKGRWFRIVSDKPAAVRRRRTNRRKANGLKSRRIDVHTHDFAKALEASRRASIEETRKPALVRGKLEEVVNDFIERWRPEFKGD